MRLSPWLALRGPSPFVRSLALVLALAECRAADPGSSRATGAVRIDAVMADPRDMADDRGEWIRLRNSGTMPVRLRGWIIASGGDTPHRIAADVVIPAGGLVVLARSAAARP